MEATKKFAGQRVFLALRPDIANKPDEHITVAWLGHFPLNREVIYTGKYWKKRLGLPVTVVVNGYATWRTGVNGRYCNVLLVEFMENLELSMSKNWHVTVESSLERIPWEERAQEYLGYSDIVTQLWVGWKEPRGSADTEKKWIRFEDYLNQLKVDQI